MPEAISSNMVAFRDSFEPRFRFALLYPALGDAEITEREVRFCQGLFGISQAQISEDVMRTTIGLPGSGHVGMPLIVP
jgi:hypothetical protein